MSDQKTRTAHGQIQFEKKQVAAREGAKAMAHYDAQAKATRTNMEKLKALRLAKEAEDALNAPAVVPKAKKAAKKSAKGSSRESSQESSKESSKEPAAKLGEWLNGQAKGGHRT